MKTLIKFFIFFLILIIGFAGIAYYWTFYKPLPNYSATFNKPELHEPVKIFWDDFGVPHIYATNEEDLYFALGYVHAQDRLWQMTLTQMAAEGRFAEFFGKELVPYDKYQRTLGFWKTAKTIEKEALNDHERTILQAYADGVNNYVKENHNRLPIEFSLANMEPFEWNATRSIAIIRMIGWELNMSWWSEVTYSYLKGKLSPEQFDELQLHWSDDAPTTLNDAESMKLSANLMPMLEQEMELRKLMQAEGTHVGSNAWVVDGSRTGTGFPLLAGDPHLGLDMPGKWYEVHLNLNGKNVSGATLAGVPGIVIGQNDEMAWSLTNIMADDTDFFLEVMDSQDRGRYVVDSLSTDSVSYQPFHKEREVIKVKDGDDDLLEIRYTKHGPVISDIFSDPDLINQQIISMSWTGYDISNELRALYQINWAHDFQEFKDALQYFAVPGQNFMYGDKEGNIAMYSTAKLPVRSGDPLTLRKGWDPKDDWQGYIPQAQMPHVVNPEKGWIANANNKLTSPNYGHYLATFWEPSSRIERIEQVLTANSTVTPEIFMKLQNDSYSAFAAKITPLVTDIIRNQNEYDFSLPLSYLENWDYKYEKSATAASIFDVFFKKLSENTLKDEFGEEAYSNFIKYENMPVRTLSGFMKNGSSFFDNINTETIEAKENIVLKSMQDAMLFLSDSLGSEPSEWRWEQLHTITFEPPLFGTAAKQPNAPKTLKLIVNNILSEGPFPVVGHGMSVNNGQYDWHEPYKMVLGASIRRIVDFTDLTKIKTVLPAGQSGNPLSEHFGDQTEMWLNGRYRTLYQDSALVKQTNPDIMTLLPELQ